MPNPHTDALPAVDEHSDEDTLNMPSLADRRRAALAILNLPPSPLATEMTEDEIMAFAVAEVHAYRRGKADAQ